MNWLHEFGLTKGLANLNLIYAQMSVWHIFQAGFPNILDVLLRINVVFLVIYLIYIFEKSLEFTFYFTYFSAFCSISSPDLPTIALSLIILNEILKGNQNAKLLLRFRFCFQYKTYDGVVAYFVFYIFKKSTSNFGIRTCSFRNLYFQNIWVFGYPFPVQMFDLGVSWLPNAEILKQSSEVAILKTYDLKFTISEIQQFTTWDYIYHWFTLHS